MNTFKIFPIKLYEKAAFIKHAINYFTELNEHFIPSKEFKNEYFEKLKKSKELYLVWLIYNNEKVGFAIFGTEKHRFLKKKTGKIYDFYIFKEKRKNKIGYEFSKVIINELFKKNIDKIEVEVLTKNKVAYQFWIKQDFEDYSIKLYLKK